MRHHAIPSGWEGDARPDGGYVVAMHGGVWLSTHLGPMERPDDASFRYPRLTPTGPLKIAGYDTRLRKWAAGAWLDAGPVPAAVSPVIYDRAGDLHIINRAVHDSASGFLYVAPDGTPVTAEQADRPGDVRYLIDLGEGWQVAQGQHGGCWMVTPEGRYLAIVEEGASPFRDAMFIRAQRDGDAVAICYYERPVPVAHLFWFTLAEARQVFPAFDTPRPPVTYAPVVPIGRPIWMGWFFDGGGEPANCRFYDPSATGHKRVLMADWRYVSGDPDGDPVAIEAAIQQGRTTPLPVLAYVPQKAFSALPTSADLQGIECYLWSGEDDETFLHVRSEMIRKCARVVLIAQCYDNRNPNAPDLRRVPGLISQLARDHANVEGILVFSGSGRATGWGDHPEVHDAWRQVFAGITGVPVAVTPEPPALETPPVNHPEIPESSPAPAPEEPPVPEQPPTMTQPPYTPPVAHRPDTPVSGSLWGDIFRALSRINFRKLFRGKPKPQLPLPSLDVPPEPAPPPVADPPYRLPIIWPHVGLSHYQALGDPDFDWARFLDVGKTYGVGYHRTWLIDAWATKDIGGLYDGFLPCRRRHDGLFDLFDWRADYFARLRWVTQQSNERGIFPLWTLLELYSWSTRKGTNPGVPDVNRNLFRANVNGVRWGVPDDLTFGAPPYEGQGLPDEWLRAFTARVLESLSGTSYALLIGNEMPEKEMHWRIVDMLRDLGYDGEIVINRNEDGPGQPFNMGMVGAGGSRYDRHEFHLGTADEAHTAGYLDVEHAEEAAHGRPTTIRALLGRVDPSRIIVSSDGDGGRIVPAQTALAREVLRLGASFERQSNLKRNRFFGDGSLRMSDLDAEVPFLSQIRS